MRVIVMEHWEDSTRLATQLDALCRLLHRNNIPDRCVDVQTGVAIADYDDSTTSCYWARVTLRVPAAFEGLAATDGKFPKEHLNATFDHVCDVQWPRLQQWTAKFVEALAPFVDRHNDEATRTELKDALTSAYDHIASKRWKTAQSLQDAKPR